MCPYSLSFRRPVLLSGRIAPPFVQPGLINTSVYCSIVCLMNSFNKLKKSISYNELYLLCFFALVFAFIMSKIASTGPRHISRWSGRIDSCLIRIRTVVYPCRRPAFKHLLSCTVPFLEPTRSSVLSCVENNGFEPLTPCVQSRCSSQLS